MTNGVPSRQTLSKCERISKRLLIDELFGSRRSTSMTAFPLRVVFIEKAERGDNPAVQVLVSVPKRYLKHAVDRNRVKRQVREAYRKQKQSLVELMDGRTDKQLLVAFVWIDSALHPSDEVHQKVGNLLLRIGERLCR